MKFLSSAILAGLAVPLVSQAALTISVYEANGNTYFDASGTLNLTGVNRTEVVVGEESGVNLFSVGGLINDDTFSSAIEPSQGTLFMTADIPLPITMYLYESTEAPESFGFGGAAFASQYSGAGSPNFGLVGDPDFFHGILLQTDSDSTFEFDQSMVFNGQTLDALGIAEGSYTWKFSNGQLVTMNVAVAAPEPTTWAAVIALGALSFTFYRRRR